MGKSGILNAKNTRGYAVDFRQDLGEKDAKRCTALVKNGGVEALEIPIKSENRYGGD